MLSRFALFFITALVLSFAPAQAAAKISLEGHLATYYIDYVDHDHHAHKSELFYRLNLKSGKKIKLKFLSPPKNLNKIDLISVKGFKDGDKLVVESYKELESRNKKARLIGTTQSQSSGNQVTLIAGVRDPLRSPSSPIHSSSEIEDAMFSTTGVSVNAYFREVSKNRTFFTGAVSENLTVNSMCAGGDIFAQFGDYKALNALIDAGFDIKQYDRISLIVPSDSACLPAGVAGVGSLGFFSIPFTDGTTHSISINIVKSFIPTNSEDLFFRNVLIHEFGHNLGLDHDNANVCGEDIYTIRCASLEYGGAHSIMGFAPTFAHLNAIHQEDLGWLTSSEMRELDETAINEVINLSPISETSSNLKSLKIPLGDGTHYVVEYRQAQNFDAIPIEAGLSSNRDGILIYHNDDLALNNSALLDSNMLDRRAGLSRTSFGTYFDFELAQQFNELAPFNNEFHDHINGIRITPITLGSTASIRVETQLSDGGATTAGEEPAAVWTIRPPSSPETLQYEYFYLKKNGEIIYTYFDDETIDRVEWDFDNDGATDLVRDFYLPGYKLFKEAGSYTVAATIYFKDETNIKVTSDPVEVTEYISTNLFPKGNTTQSENKLKSKKPSRYIYQLKNIQDHTMRLRIKPNTSFYRRFIKIKKKQVKIEPGQSKNIPIIFAPGKKFKKLTLNSDGYYQIPLTMIENTTTEGTKYSYPSLLIKPADSSVGF